MKHYGIYVLSIISTLSIYQITADHFNIALEPKWYTLDHNGTKANQFGGKWVLVGSIIFTKRCDYQISMNTISFYWNGQKLDNLIASLYKKNLEKDIFLPIEENLVCDGIWNKKKQTLLFNFEEKINLAPTTIFYLVLTIPESTQNILSNGSFTLEKQYLPKPFKKAIPTEKLSLAIDTTSSSCLKR